MDRGLAGIELDRYDLTKIFRVIHGLVEDVIFSFAAFTPGEVPLEMGAGDEAHAGVAEIRLVDRQPDGHSF